MISSPLIRPLVAPLVSRRGNSTRRGGGIRGSALAATALAISALLAVAAPAEAEAKAEVKVVQNAHAKPARVKQTPIWMSEVVAILTGRTELAAPSASPEFDNRRLALDRLRHAHDPGLERGPGLSRGRRLDRLLARDLAFLHFGSARVLAAQPHN